ncbi:GNAT superfamily N-acetyltransferase [Silvimonas terrae]|uniref:GNAT superfamily N-acetyltransferase n=1 Tax=Silvimonas terrae TaxID=300266 RepID=A0A840RDW3_9NEIS|nr:GNAT family N-acetyltransferase [Silvimonas terrae]MBB5190626.1 GNAT superfamily N-acetyltransferase [Silvimonas terrae]
MSSHFTVERVAHLSSNILEDLAHILHACVENGASVSFMLPFSPARAQGFWQAMAGEVANGNRIFLVARDEDGRVVGTVHAILNLPENQPHRADVAKLLVHPAARKGGIGAALMRELVKSCAAAGKTLLVLDTVTGGAAERLYAREGWTECGKIPGFALMPDGELCGTTVFYKTI